MDKATKKQLNFIWDIERVTGKTYMGTTKEEASEFIAENIELYRLYTSDKWALINGYI